MGFTVKGVLRRVLRRGSGWGVSRKCLERPLGEYDNLGVSPKSFRIIPPKSHAGKIQETKRTHKAKKSHEQHQRIF